MVKDKRERWTLREGYILALLPALGLTCVHMYEAGRFSFLGVPSQLIDLPVTRLIGGGTAIVIFAVIVAGFIQWAKRQLVDKAGFRRFLGIYAICFALIGVPQLLQVSTRNGAFWAFILPLSIALMWTSSDESKADRSDANEQSPNVIGFLFLFGLLAWIVFSVGFFLERFDTTRMCLGSNRASFIAGFYGESAIVKSVDPRDSRVKPGVEIRDTGSSLQVHECVIFVKGMPSVFDRAFN